MMLPLQTMLLAFVGVAVASPVETITSQTAGCTTTITEFDRGFTGDFNPSTTITIYNQTVTTVSPVDCHGCSYVTTTVEQSPFWGGIGPEIPDTDSDSDPDPNDNADDNADGYSIVWEAVTQVHTKQE
ncbi:hypothetical protein CORC01_02940 [Colletotrichum orchidophilum]|uniref:Uncharacterized protein n=1 Tax=Colletotrichum orchidophilum TaxID=1209926 RepID=A0A1G4BJY5_9PEZI|nr:uncharacterized protein CORC01_02940 [Colletotrichum orchidophilum]OHF01749.1 hypothetical protein CORC01_02940 [Colletotrichum orchidophilum]